MPTLSSELRHTYLFRADTHGTRKEYASEEPVPCVLPLRTWVRWMAPESSHIWSWKHDPSKPAVLEDLKILNRRLDYKRRSRVLDRLEVKSVSTTVDGTRWDLPLTPAFVVQKFSLEEGHLEGDDVIPVTVDQSILVVFGYEFGSSDGPGPVPLSKERADALGEDLMPLPPMQERLVRLLDDEDIAITVDSTRVLVALSVTCCKESQDHEPGELLWAAKIYPHVMVMGNRKLGETEVVIELERPEHGDHGGGHGHGHGHEPVRPFFFTDTNTEQENVLFAALKIPRPYWQIIFDYYELNPTGFLALRSPSEVHPKARTGESCFVDADVGARRVEAAVQRSPNRVPPPGRSDSGMPEDYYFEPEAIRKVARQGEFDNVHFAPPMRTTVVTNEGTAAVGLERLEDIIMAPFCVHDCFHTHLRWSDSEMNPDRAFTRGFAGSTPYQKRGAAMVPFGQSVYISLPNRHTLRYRAVQEKIEPGLWEFYYHHGSFYAVTMPDAPLWVLKETLLDVNAEALGEPYSTDCEFPSGKMNRIAEMYWRLQFGGYQHFRDDAGFSHHPLPRLRFDLSKCLK